MFCSFEALLRHIQVLHCQPLFTKRMMHSARDSDVIPEENFAKKGSNCNDTVMTKRMFTDDSRILHHPAAVGGSDWGDCYDRAAHPAASLAFRSWGVPQAGCRVLLMALWTMHYCLRTGFVESKEMYGGTEEDPFQGYGQGNCASPARVLGTQRFGGQRISQDGPRGKANISLHQSDVPPSRGHVR